MRAAIIAITVAATSARAEGFAQRLELGAGTVAPLAIDAEATVHITDRIDADVAAGIMPPQYVDLINAAIVGFGGYDDTTATLIAAALDKAIVVRIGGAYRPFRFPLSFHAGYTIAALGGSVGDAKEVEAVTGQDVMTDGGRTVPMHSTLHLFQLGAAWRFTLSPALVLRVSLEYAQAFASSTAIDISPRLPGAAARIAKANAAFDAYMDDIYGTYVKAPVIGVSLRWRPGH
jgi:hypothetical protein